MAKSLHLTPAARDYILSHRPELRAEFEELGDSGKGCIRLASLLQPASNPSQAQYVPNLEGPVLDKSDVERKALKSEPFRLGDFVAALLRRLRVEAFVAALMRRGLIRECQCAARQARLNALSARMGRLLEPPLTLAVLFFWLLLVVMLLVR